MEIKMWKREPKDKYTMMDIPSYKAVSIVELNGGRITATVSLHGKIEYWTVELPTKKLEETLEILHNLKNNGMDFDENGTVTDIP